MNNLLTTVTAILLTTFLSVSTTAQDKSAGFDPKLDAAKDIANGIQLARIQNKRALIYVGDNGCGWCRNLSQIFDTNEEASALLSQSYVLVKVNWSLENKNEQVLSRYPRPPGYPHLYMLDGNGKLLHSQRTFLLHGDGRHDPAKVIAFLKQWSLNI